MSFLRIPEPVNPNIGAELFLRPEEIIYHQLNLLRYRVEVEILEIQDWRELSDDSDGPMDYPDRLDYSDDDDYPGFNDNLRSSPWPRKTVFRRLEHVSDVSLERVCFDGVSLSIAALDSPNSRRNVNTSRGPLPTEYTTSHSSRHLHAGSANGR